MASNVNAWANESFAIARKPEVEYCVLVGDTWQYAVDNREFDEGEPEKVVVVTMAPGQTGIDSAEVPDPEPRCAYSL